MDFIRERIEHMEEDLVDMWELSGEKFTVHVSENTCLNGLKGQTGEYFVEFTVPVVPQLNQGDALDYWLVNGEKRTGVELHVGAEDAVDGVVNVEWVGK